MTTFADPWNPSSTEVRSWAYSADAVEPCQDWDLSLSWVGHERDYLEFAADPNCPNQHFFLHVLYFMVGDAVRNSFRSTPEIQVRGFVELAASTRSKSVHLWRERALHLIEHPAEFEYASWCEGGLASAQA